MEFGVMTYLLATRQHVKTVCHCQSKFQ